MNKMKMALIVGLVCVLAAAMVIMPSCKPATTAATTAAPEKVMIGISIGMIGAVFCEGLRDGSRDKVKELGGEPIVLIADGDATLQSTQIEDMVAQGCQAVIVFAVDTDAITTSAKYCQDKGVIFSEFSRISPDLTNIDLAIGFDNKQQAELCGQAMLDAAKKVGYPEVKCIEMVGHLADQNAIERQVFFEAFAEANGIKIVATVLTDWDGELATSRFKDAITLVGGDYNAIYAPSDFLLTPIMAVLSEQDLWVKQGEEGWKIIVAIDGAPDALEKIRTGYVYEVTNTDVLQLGRETAIKTYDMIVNGTKYEGDKKVIIIPAVAMTAENCDDPVVWGNNY